MILSSSSLNPKPSTLNNISDMPFHLAAMAGRGTRYLASQRHCADLMTEAAFGTGSVAWQLLMQCTMGLGQDLQPVRTCFDRRFGVYAHILRRKAEPAQLPSGLEPGDRQRKVACHATRARLQKCKEGLEKAEIDDSEYIGLHRVT